jgi:hypothetical protein
MAAVVPAVLVLLALIAGFAGFRAATGRNARIRKRCYYLMAVYRGFGGGAAGLGLVALVVAMALGSAADPGARYDGLVRAGTRMLVALAPFAALVVVSLLANWVLPMRVSTFVILVGLGPFTLVRPVVVLGVGFGRLAGLGSRDSGGRQRSGRRAGCPPPLVPGTGVTAI